jgi:hypothetical protein
VFQVKEQHEPVNGGPWVEGVLEVEEVLMEGLFVITPPKPFLESGHGIGYYLNLY